jgi:hypothetical protein
MIHHNTSNTSTTSFRDRAKLPTMKLKARSALSMGLIRSKRLLGTLHLRAPLSAAAPDL